MKPPYDLTVIGGGLAGSEAALQAAHLGLKVHLIEMRPNKTTGAHISGNLSELVCSNSFGSTLPDRASGILKNELRQLNSYLLMIAEEAAVPAGRALAVDRTLFSQLVTEKIYSDPNIIVSRIEAKTIPEGPVILATGPLTSPDLAKALSIRTGEDYLFFFDAVAPIISVSSIDFSIAFRASRYQLDGQDEGDYINLPFSKEDYFRFVDLLVSAERINLQPFEIEINSGVKAGMHEFFEGCLPVEILARRGRDSLAFGPMRPVGLIDPHTNKRPYAVVQLRQDDLSGELFNMVGFQTNLTYKEQVRIFQTIPGLQQAEFERFGQMHRNTYIASPKLIHPNLQFRSDPRIFFAGQITGVEGYAGNIGTGILAGINASRYVMNLDPLVLPETTILGALCNYITHASMKDFQPMKANLGILPALPTELKIGKRERGHLQALRSQTDLQRLLENS